MPGSWSDGKQGAARQAGITEPFRIVALSCFKLPFLPSVFPDFLSHKATGQLVRQSLLPAISQFWDKVKIKNKVIY